MWIFCHIDHCPKNKAGRLTIIFPCLENHITKVMKLAVCYIHYLAMDLWKLDKSSLNLTKVMEYCCHIWSGSAKTHCPILLQFRIAIICSLAGDELFGTLKLLCHRCDVSSNTITDCCLDELHQIDPPLKLVEVVK